MKLRIGALLAMAVLIIGIIALLREWRRNLVGDAAAGSPAPVEKAASIPAHPKPAPDGNGSR